MNDAKKLIQKARMTNAKRDAHDGGCHLGAPGATVIRDGVDLTHIMHLRVAMSAIWCGIQTGEPDANGSWDCVAEGLAMLEKLHVAMSPIHDEYQQDSL